ncbi:MAG: TonB family protein [Dysgonamonadaceae bacterium]|jgi:TonB family protein|nr:TonB family protein [Dysgonamonadaceae bacterium]
MKITKEKLIGGIVAAICCGLLFLLLYSSVIKTIIKPKEQKTLVHFGTIDPETGTFEPRPENNLASAGNPEPAGASAPAPPPNPQQIHPKPTPAKPSAPPVITQNRDKTAAVSNAEAEREKQEQARKKAEEERQKAAINQQAANAFGSGGQGNSSGNGTDSSSGNSGSYGTVSLSGRTLGSGGLPLPAYSQQEEGRIVVNITVNPQGKVVLVAIGRGTTITDATMRQAALDAARKATFNVISGTENQSGSITYNYKLN